MAFSRCPRLSAVTGVAKVWQMGWESCEIVFASRSKLWRIASLLER
jgi:hypothetical protein